MGRKAGEELPEKWETVPIRSAGINIDHFRKKIDVSTRQVSCYDNVVCSAVIGEAIVKLV